MSALATQKFPLSSQPRLADAFGNQLASATTGTALWASDAASAGWGHNTKEHDATTGLVYMYQRWYQPETGTFLSLDRFPGIMEMPETQNRYSFGFASPTHYLDADGDFAFLAPLLKKVAFDGGLGCVGGIGGATGASLGGGAPPSFRSLTCACVGGAIGGIIGGFLSPAGAASAGAITGGMAAQICDDPCRFVNNRVKPVWNAMKE